MKSSFITFASLFFFLIGAVVAAPTTLESTEIVKRDFQPLDSILNEGYSSLIVKNTAYNATTIVTSADVTAYCNDIIVIINVIVTKCGLIPAGTIFLDINLIASLLFKILCEINYTLQLLLSKCGILGLILLILSLVNGLITALNHLLVVVGGLCGTGLLGLLSTLIISNCGLGFLLLLLGLVI
ncbi:hypothetical protein B9Z19DRAFT_1136636 [Tuber borchii]|uniref:Uncharacterized protein n=1 Tax=Tuber borchii TaxID=42251 RepID=A0A2T6ZBH1_TUBBO|nr:hypothetical protein B9Z19DRAFT_1136636 [Tuber borchii]